MKERRRYTLDNAEDFFAFNYSIKELLAQIYREELQACVYNAFYQVMMPQYGADPAECYKARFYSYGLFGFLDEWTKRGFYETPEQITELFRKMIRGNKLARESGHNTLVVDQRAHGKSSGTTITFGIRER